MAQVGTGEYTYEQIHDFFKLPDGQSFGLVSRVAADAHAVLAPAVEGFPPTQHFPELTEAQAFLAALSP